VSIYFVIDSVPLK